MKIHKFLTQLALIMTLLLLSPLAAHAISGNYFDEGGGTYLLSRGAQE